ncbi:MAG: aldo/keto reductase [Alphaproteobacteria bacterium]|nr:aldo/keto reductase [Alphaproteobacteria bacterium]
MTVTMKIWTGSSVPRVGMGCWAIGGPMKAGDLPTYYGAVDDDESRRALRLAYDLGARVFDTAANYGAGHSETLIGEEISRYDDAVIVTKFGYVVDEVDKTWGPYLVSPEGIRQTINDSRRRLRRDVIDLALLHINEFPAEEAEPIFEALVGLHEEGKIRAFGWSTDFIESARAFAHLPGFVAIENDYNVFTPAREVMALCEQDGFVSLSRLPLAMGLLTGKYRPDDKLAGDDIRAQNVSWLRFFKNGKPNAAYLDGIAAIRDLLQTGERTLAQGALGWILAKSPVALPVPGFKTEAQVRDNLGTLEKGPLPAAVMTEIDKVLKDFAVID